MAKDKKKKKGKGKKKESVEERVLEAQKVVVSNFLWWWKVNFGLDYIIAVRNAPGDIFVRTSSGADEEMLEAIRDKMPSLDEREKQAVQVILKSGSPLAKVISDHMANTDDSQE